MFIFPKKSLHGKDFCAPKVNNILGPVNKYPFKAPNTDINIPTVMNLPPNGPNIASATADAGEEY